MNAWLARQGEGYKYVPQALEKKLISIGWLKAGGDLSPFLGLEQREFFDAVRPLLLQQHPDTKPNAVSGTLGQLYRFAVLIKPGDIVFMPEERGMLAIGKVTSGYAYEQPEQEEGHWHRRSVEWIGSVPKTLLSEELKNAAGGVMTVFSLTPYIDEITLLLQKFTGSQTTETEGEMIFGLEAHLEDFLVENWKGTALGKDYDVYEAEDGTSGQQLVTDIGRIDILARRKDGTGWLVIELKKGKENDKVIGQVLRYIGWVRRNLAEGEEVKGLVVVHERDEQLTYALEEVADRVSAYRYEVSFNLANY
jgi:restriction system protein